MINFCGANYLQLSPGDKLITRVWGDALEGTVRGRVSEPWGARPDHNSFLESVSPALPLH